MFIDYNQLPHDSNYVINAIMLALREKRKTLGPDLFIQLDNTSKEFFLLSIYTKISKK